MGIFHTTTSEVIANKSTNNALMSIIENTGIQTQLDEGIYCTGIFVDLKKAFDTVDHKN